MFMFITFLQEEQRLQQLMQQQLAQQKAIEQAHEVSAIDSSKRLQFKWAEKAIAASKPLQVKSLAQIQQEEQERVDKIKVFIASWIYKWREILFSKDCAMKNWNILATGKGTVGESRPEGIRKYAAERWNMGHGVAMLELG